MLITASQSPAGDVQAFPRLAYRGTLKLLGVFALWTALAFVFATQLYFAGLPWNVALAWTLPRWYSWGLLTPGVFWLDRRLAAATTLPARLTLHVPLGVAWTSVAILLRLVTRPLRGTALPDDFPDYFLDRFYSDLLDLRRHRRRLVLASVSQTR